MRECLAWGGHSVIESRLEPADEGTGGGYGNYPGLTVFQVADRFRHLAEEGHNRSARAVLRIVHEQTAARGTLAVQPILAGLAALASVVLFVAYRVVPEADRHRVAIYLGAALVSTLLLSAGALSIRRTARRNARQVREIRRLALLALSRIVEAPGFRPKLLEREHLRSLNEMRKTDPEVWERVVKALSVA